MMQAAHAKPVLDEFAFYINPYKDKDAE